MEIEFMIMFCGVPFGLWKNDMFEALGEICEGINVFENP